MKVLICPDKFKFTFSAREIARIIDTSVKTRGHETQVAPLSDGGEGFLEIISGYVNGQKIRSRTVDPLLRPMESYFLFDKATKTAYLELALTGSMQLLKPVERNPLNTTTVGLGLQIKQAMKLGAETIFIGLGGSSTTDMGMGMAHALGYGFYDWQNNRLWPIGRNMTRVQRIVSPQAQWPVVKACVDVDNPLYGEQGAAMVYSRQKGAGDEAIMLLDRGLRNMAVVVEQVLGIRLNTSAGEGAAGGLGAGIKAFLHGEIMPGADMIFSLAGLEEKMQWADVVITGEGSFDEQSLRGKVTGRVVEMARRLGKRVVVVAGVSSVEQAEGVTIVPLFDQGVDLERAKRETPERVRECLVI